MVFFLWQCICPDYSVIKIGILYSGSLIGQKSPERSKAAEKRWQCVTTNVRCIGSSSLDLQRWVFIHLVRSSFYPRGQIVLRWVKIQKCTFLKIPQWPDFEIFFGDRGGLGNIRTTFGSSGTFFFCWCSFRPVVLRILWGWKGRRGQKGRRGCSPGASPSQHHPRCITNSSIIIYWKSYMYLFQHFVFVKCHDIDDRLSAGWRWWKPLLGRFPMGPTTSWFITWISCLLFASTLGGVQSFSFFTPTVMILPWWLTFSAVQNSSICDLVTHSLTITH